MVRVSQETRVSGLVTALSLALLVQVVANRMTVMIAGLRWHHVPTNILKFIVLLVLFKVVPYVVISIFSYLKPYRLNFNSSISNIVRWS